MNGIRLVATACSRVLSSRIDAQLISRLPICSISLPSCYLMTIVPTSGLEPAPDGFVDRRPVPLGRSKRGVGCGAAPMSRWPHLVMTGRSVCLPGELDGAARERLQGTQVIDLGVNSEEFRLREDERCRGPCIDRHRCRTMRAVVRDKEARGAAVIADRTDLFPPSDLAGRAQSNLDLPRLQRRGRARDVEADIVAVRKIGDRAQLLVSCHHACSGKVGPP